MGRVGTFKQQEHQRRQEIMESVNSHQSTTIFPVYTRFNYDSAMQTRSYLNDQDLMDSDDSESSNTSSDDTTASDIESWLPISEELGRISEMSLENKQTAPRKKNPACNNEKATSMNKTPRMELSAKRCLKEQEQTTILKSQKNSTASPRSQEAKRTTIEKNSKKVDDEPRALILKRKKFGYGEAQSSSSRMRELQPTPVEPLIETSSAIPPTVLNLSTAAPFICDVVQCQDVFKSLQRLTKHQSSHADMNRLFVCPFCTQRFFYLKTLKRHCSMKHKDLKYAIPNDTYTCDICDKKLQQPGIFKKHLHNHYDLSKKFACAICKQRFKAPKNLALHLALSHSNTVTS